MRTYLLTWNPKDWPWASRPADAATCRATGRQRQRWSCGRTRSIPVGSRLFLMQVGSGVRGLVASGHSVGAPFEDVHWDPAMAAAGKKSWYVQVEFDVIAVQPVVERGELDAPPFDRGQWSPRAGGIRIPDDVALALELLWRERTGGTVHPDDVPAGPTYTEGAVQTITVNAYERNEAARAACLAHYGRSCSVCGLVPEQAYGPGFEGVIHVHHLSPISGALEARTVDPVTDLRPVCPTCHAALHRRSPPYTPEELRAMMGR